MATKTLSGDGWRVTADEETFELVIDARPGPWRTSMYWSAPLLSLAFVALGVYVNVQDHAPHARDNGLVVMVVMSVMAAATLLNWWLTIRPAAIRARYGDETVRVTPDRIEYSCGTERRRTDASVPRSGDVVVLAERFGAWERFFAVWSGDAVTAKYGRLLGRIGVHCPVAGTSSRLGTELSASQAQALIDACRAAEIPTRGLRFTPFDVWPPPRADS